METFTFYCTFISSQIEEKENCYFISHSKEHETYKSLLCFVRRIYDCRENTKEFRRLNCVFHDT